MKMFGLAALAAVAAMAVVGATSASAESTQLCKENSAGLTCPEGQAAVSIHQLAALPILKTSLVTVHCEYALFQGEALALGAPQQIHGAFTYINCETTGGTECVVEEVSAGILIEVLKLGTEANPELADVAGSGEVKVQCGALINCIYGGNELVGHGLGPTETKESEETEGTDHVTFTEAVVNRVKGFCPATSKLTALFKGLPNPTYLRS